MEGPEHVEVFGSHVVAHLGAGWLSLMVQYLALIFYGAMEAFPEPGSLFIKQ